MCLKICLPKVRDQTVTDKERKELFQLAQSLWTLMRQFMPAEVPSDVICYPLEKSMLLGQVSHKTTGHDKIFNSKQVLHVALRRLALKAWDTSRLSGGARSQILREKRQDKGGNLKYFTDAASSHPFSASDANTSLDSLSESIGFEAGPNSEINVDDWIF
ncbi:hypothetical protein N7508_007835 [Penicillium antarcticum]|uniref:uncharacterized protein n=1 Tax=Penicillium antarcticum TaxID=416450 RepID=UPI00239EC548|nr:uncharacterized protein N7508_007835 [Penicillium antarcticum]KAJ5297586.1 hypothetical protein N7508_007835 [Penicillium antarcticum]